MGKGDPSRVGFLFGRLLDLVYPPSCGCCGVRLRDGRGLCDECGAGLPRLADPFCQRCGEPFEGEIDGVFDCPNCGKLRFAFEFARPALKWDEETRQLIHRLKYDREIHLAEELGRLAAEALRDPRFADALTGAWPLVPVPLHRSRLLHRHFNQSAEIARVVGRVSGLPVVPALRRIRRTDTQTRLSRGERLRNLAGAFAVSRTGGKWLTRAGGVILVDDVLTTGSTVESCAAALKAAGFKRIQVLTVMRG